MSKLEKYLNNLRYCIRARGILAIPHVRLLSSKANQTAAEPT